MNITDGKCHFCKNEINDQYNLFYYCNITREIITELKKLFRNIYPDLPSISKHIMIVGFHNDNAINETKLKVCNLILYTF